MQQVGGGAQPGQGTGPTTKHAPCSCACGGCGRRLPPARAAALLAPAWPHIGPCPAYRLEAPPVLPPPGTPPEQALAVAAQQPSVYLQFTHTCRRAAPPLASRARVAARSNAPTDRRRQGRARRARLVERGRPAATRCSRHGESPSARASPPPPPSPAADASASLSPAQALGLLAGVVRAVPQQPAQGVPAGRRIQRGLRIGQGAGSDAMARVIYLSVYLSSRRGRLELHSPRRSCCACVSVGMCDVTSVACAAAARAQRPPGRASNCRLSQSHQRASPRRGRPAQC